MRSLLFIAILFPFFLKAQTPADIVMGNAWYLTDMHNECFWDGPGDPNEYSDIVLTFNQSEDVVYFHTKMCSQMDGTVQLTDTEISFHNLLISGTPCQDPLNKEYEDGYICLLSHDFDYEIIVESDGSLTLKLENPVFMDATFSNKSLSTMDLNPELGNVYPNPFTEILTVSNPKLKFDRITITDLMGNKVFDTPAKEVKNNLDLRAFPAGIYILRMSRKGKFIGSRKVIKR